MTIRLNPWVRCPQCSKIHIAHKFEFVCACGATIDLVKVRVK